jgi:hypothetical protein
MSSPCAHRSSSWNALTPFHRHGWPALQEDPTVCRQGHRRRHVAREHQIDIRAQAAVPSRSCERIPPLSRRPRRTAGGQVDEGRIAGPVGALRPFLQRQHRAGDLLVLRGIAVEEMHAQGVGLRRRRHVHSRFRGAAPRRDDRRRDGRERSREARQSLPHASPCGCRWPGSRQASHRQPGRAQANATAATTFAGIRITRVPRHSQHEPLRPGQCGQVCAA